MKTSNKILLGLLVVVFTVPLLLAAALKSKIKKGEYTVKKYQNISPEQMRSGSFTAFKVVKVIAPRPGLLTCSLTQSNEMNYKYNVFAGKDSVKVFTNNDTLYIEYIIAPARQGEEENYSEHLNIAVELPAVNNIVVDGAEVIINSPASSVLSVTLLNNGEIRDGSKRNMDGARLTLPNNTINRNVKAEQTAMVEEETEAGNDDETSEDNTTDYMSWNFKDLLISRIVTRF